MSRIEPLGQEHVLSRAALGQAPEDWQEAQRLIEARLTQVLASWPSSIDAVSLAEQINAYPAPPHTIQRLAELLVDPHRWYTDVDKYVRALVKVLSVTSTTLDFTQEEAQPEPAETSLLVPIPWLTEDMRTVMPNGVVFTNGPLDDMPTGSAPMDAADLGPQSDETKEAIAHYAGAQAQSVQMDDYPGAFSDSAVMRSRQAEPADVAE
ncbi:PPP4R2-domain-containing protein [Protomyces lactucae-debilis]|uniref:PPP4R2-domain-containing protein n=1 Tax=Protomyces lactucae-debilis TaxID=2754530 RepID=A0A1Y2EYR5_PROLT|nr:PPP4R2-domain-containing protein [Protomyces lactucae-debilis]ORY76700.1 PPP4R2-domain-containing protein [Protomyces lactucae-debilis]